MSTAPTIHELYARLAKCMGRKDLIGLNLCLLCMLLTGLFASPGSSLFLLFLVPSVALLVRNNVIDKGLADDIKLAYEARGLHCPANPRVRWQAITMLEALQLHDRVKKTA